MLSFLQALQILVPWLHVAVKYKATKTHMNFAAEILLRVCSDLVAGAGSRILWVARTGQRFLALAFPNRDLNGFLGVFVI